MISLLNTFSGKPDHPMSDIQAARALLAELPDDDELSALNEITAWLDSVRDTRGFSPELRTQLFMLLDETGQPLHAKLLRLYLAAPHLQDFQGMHLWQEMHDFSRALSEAYAAILHEFQQTDKKPWTIKEHMPVICVRLMRAYAEQMKLELMRYIEVDAQAWERMYRCYSYAAANQFDNMVYAYANQVIHTSPKRELLRAMMLHISSPGTLAPDQIEASFRIAGRLLSLFDFKDTPDPDCAYFIDLASPAAPASVTDGIIATPSMRFFGAVRASPKIMEIMDHSEDVLIQHMQRADNEFTPAGKLTVLKHLQLYWGKELPHRNQERKAINTTIAITRGFRILVGLVRHADEAMGVILNAEQTSQLQESSEFKLLAEEAVRHTAEEWVIADASTAGLGCVVPRGTGGWIKIGKLCGLKAKNNPLWWIGTIRRLHTDPKNTAHAGIEILTKKPLSVWLRTLGKGTETVSNWESSSGSFKYDYLPVILLPDDKNSYLQATLLMESGHFVTDAIYQMMMGEKSRDIKLTSLLAEGEDYEQVKFEWLNGGKT